jgi:hypothetical protein
MFIGRYIKMRCQSLPFIAILTFEQNRTHNSRPYKSILPFLRHYVQKGVGFFRPRKLMAVP